MKSLRIVCTGIILLSTIFIYAQSEIELRTDGIVVPRTTSAAVVSPIKGMLIYDTDIDGFKYYDGTDWLNIGGGTGGSVAWSDITGKPAGFADGTDHIDDADANASNELQTISKSGSTVTLSNSGGSFSIDDADANASNELQTISKSGSTVTLSDSGGSFSIDDADANATNELQTISKSGSTVTLSDSGGSFSIDDADANASNELQTISKSGSTVTLSDGGGSFSVSDADANAFNEIQTLSLSNDVIRLSKSTPAIPIYNISPWTISGDDATKKTGNVIIGSALSPKEKLEVVGAIKLSGDASSNNPDAGSIRWNSSTVDFEGYDGTNWKSLTGDPSTNQTTYSVGDIAQGGVVYWTTPDGMHGKVIHIHTLIHYSGNSAGDWSSVTNATAGAASTTEGDLNSSIIIAQSGHTNSAAQMCLDLEANGYDDWYLPAVSEIELADLNLSIVNQALSDAGGSVFFNCWTSTEKNNDSNEAWRYQNSGSVTISKAGSSRVRAIRSF